MAISLGSVQERARADAQRDDRPGPFATGDAPAFRADDGRDVAWNSSAGLIATPYFIAKLNIKKMRRPKAAPNSLGVKSQNAIRTRTRRSGSRCGPGPRRRSAAS
jgi:hypothetical protein